MEILGGYNQAGGTINADSNMVNVRILSSQEKKAFSAGGFVAGGIIGEKQKGVGTTNKNIVNIVINADSENKLEIAKYVAGGYNGSIGKGDASGNSVVIDVAVNSNKSDFLLSVGDYVLGGFLGTTLAGTSSSGDTNNNKVTVKNSLVTSYIVGGYNLGVEGSTNLNQVKLDGVTLVGGQDIQGHFIAGGILGEGAKGNANENKVAVKDSTFRGKYLAGGVSQGSGAVNNNEVSLVNTNVEGFVAGGLDWGENGSVNLSNNKVEMLGGSVSTVRVVQPDKRELLTGRVVGARSIGNGSVTNNWVYLQQVTIEDGVRGGVIVKKGDSVNNRITIVDSRITGWRDDNGDFMGGTVAGGYIGEGGSGSAYENIVAMKNTDAVGNIVAGFSQAVGVSNASNNSIIFETDSAMPNSVFTAGGFIVGGITGPQTVGVTDSNTVKVTNTSRVAKINVRSYVAGGYNDGNGEGCANGNTVILENLSQEISNLTVENFVIGGYLRTGEGETSGNKVQVTNSKVVGASSYVAGGLNEGTGLSENNVVNLENALVEGGVLGGRVTGGSLASIADVSAANLQVQSAGKDFVGLVKNNVVNIQGNTKIYGRVAGGESLVGASDRARGALVSENKVFVNSGYIEGDIYGGLGATADVQDNVINLTGGRIKGTVYGGFSVSGVTVSRNIMNLDGAKGIDLTDAWLFGRKRVATGTDGNTLNIVNYKGEMQNMGNFDRIDLNLSGLSISVDSPIILLTEAKPTNLDNSTIHIHTDNTATAVTSDAVFADRIEIIKNQSGDMSAFNVTFEKGEVVVSQTNSPLAAVYTVEWDGALTNSGDSIDLVKQRLFDNPEAGSYIANSMSWGKMHMRLHDRFGQAYYIDPFDGLEKPAAGWVRQVGSHGHFRSGLNSKTHARTAVTQIGVDLIRNECNEDWKYIGGAFAGGLYSRADTRSWTNAKSRSDGYSLGIYGTLYTGNSPDDGFYVDSWLLFGRYHNKVWGDQSSGLKYNSRGWVWSIESGYTLPLGESGEKHFNKVIWTVQPEVQLVWDGIRASRVADSNGTQYKQLGKDNVSLRVGARLHANHMNKGLGFIEGNWIHQTQRPGVQIGKSHVYPKGARNVGEFRMGLEGHITRNMLGWATVGVQGGKAGYHNETAQIGLRYMF